ncbi:hypothetical protein IEQ34_010879 [Dendrobium chrysotoxum]|uniref:Kinesin motor domain-containing protein n=1 Tax=Dendrobium chrysotoxum TaxID=161865 RepID=A0AAV7GU04_DENCH|nr:hypothetical protein IEQ34_010879 [Dendrobium chrysotoxum]
MHSRNQRKPPMTPAYNTSENPSNARGADGIVVSYPTCIKRLGRDIDLISKPFLLLLTKYLILRHHKRMYFLKSHSLYKAHLMALSTDATHVNKQYTIKHDSASNTLVSDVTVVDLCSMNEISFLLNQAAQSRYVGKTQMNEQSSKSHFVFALRILGMNDVHGILNLIDLVGSERLAKSGSNGDRLKETQLLQAINKNLSCLSDVIFAIAKEEDHVPCRNSKLTYLLQEICSSQQDQIKSLNYQLAAANEKLKFIKSNEF